MSKEVANLEKALWESVQAKGLLHPDVQRLYRSVCRCYEKLILDNQEGVELRDIEYELWKVHYRHIFEFRKMVAKEVMERFNLFLSEAMEFYQGLIIKLKKKKPWKNSSSILYLCHRLFVCLGDLARYKTMNPDWSISAFYYFKAINCWPDSGNPHNQLALLATYMEDDFLTLYHCVRSLAVKEPFPDARNNLILPFQTNMSSLLPSLSEAARFNFFTPSERCSSETETTSRSTLWPLFVRTMSFFFVQSRIEDFDWTFASTVKELDSLLKLNNSSLRDSLESYQYIGGGSDQERKGPYRSLQMVCILIFVVSDSLNNESDLVCFSLIVIFVVMGRFVERCVHGKNKLEDCPLLPAVLVVVEWLVFMMKLVEKHSNDKRVNCSISYFFDSLVELLNLIDSNVCFNDRNALWEDYELRGFTPISKSHERLDFVDDRTTLITPYNGYESRAGRILVSGKRIADESKISSTKWICYDETGRKFYRTEVKQIANNIKVIAAEEEEVILFKPITRLNSAPPFSKAESSSDDDLRRAVSLSKQIPVQFDRETTNIENCRPNLKENSAYTAGPPSLSSWVINDGCFQIEKGKELYKPGLSTIEEPPFRHPPPPIPSAPFIPDDAVWFNVGCSKNPGIVKDTSGILGPSPMINQTANWPIAHLPSTFNPPPLIEGFPPVIGLSSSEWLRQYRNRQNLEQGSNVVWPVHHLYTNGLGEYYALDGSKLGFCDGWGNPVSPSQMVYLGNPQNQSGSLIYGVEEQRREKQINGYQRAIPYGCGAPTAEVKTDEQQQHLLQYLKEKEWQLHRQGQL
ncbi:nonsense-mediated mRNA decay factor SMG7-like [Impatiens glandulifera]|uniref:nonsense-mediated mRNA decay factor SMG7-like n=1 Tax=Impatiens glandulifera TaxID=253017 RepID=UPI001FB0B4FB|nr:nonsense-mediated mRNA decay factor SMG7-like [Impatiens glandulifera]